MQIVNDISLLCDKGISITTILTLHMALLSSYVQKKTGQNT